MNFLEVDEKIARMLIIQRKEKLQESSMDALFRIADEEEGIYIPGFSFVKP